MTGKVEEDGSRQAVAPAGGESDQGGQHVSHLVAEAALGLNSLDINENGQGRQQYRRNAPRNEDGSYVNPEDGAPRRGRGGRGRRNNGAAVEGGVEGEVIEGEEGGAPRQRRPRRQEIDPAELVVPCPQCERRFRNEQGLQRHTQALHSLVEGDEGYIPRPPRNPRRQNNNRRRNPAPAPGEEGEVVEGEAPAEAGAPVDGDRPRNPRNRNRGGRDRRNRNTNVEGGVAVEGGQQVVEGGEGQEQQAQRAPRAPRRRGGRGGGRGAGGEGVEGGVVEEGGEQRERAPRAPRRRGGRGRGAGGQGPVAVEGGEGGGYYANEYNAPQ